MKTADETGLAQPYDGAIVMSGSHNGVQKQIRDIHPPAAIYIHCMAHGLNFVIIASCMTTRHVVTSDIFLKPAVVVCVLFSPGQRQGIQLGRSAKNAPKLTELSDTVLDGFVDIET